MADRNESTVAHVYCPLGPDTTVEANCHLIASAPLLLAAIEEFLSAQAEVRLTSSAGYRESCAALDRQQAAIEALKVVAKKAKGEQP